MRWCSALRTICHDVRAVVYCIYVFLPRVTFRHNWYEGGRRPQSGSDQLASWSHKGPLSVCHVHVQHVHAPCALFFMSDVDGVEEVCYTKQTDTQVPVRPQPP